MEHTTADLFVARTTSGNRWHLTARGTRKTLCGVSVKWNHEDDDWAASHTDRANCPKCVAAAAQ